MGSILSFGITATKPLDGEDARWYQGCFYFFPAAKSFANI